ncbi:MAG: DUF4321 domain-containing protein [Armatimonadota bacterium]|nr:DUF4321 domain-containing protein [Armatimonadota bacterium]MDR5702850.1 DUF4321 domain-containing protein [Armatimonadota bacterium]MDR7435058.1 DUF4321 domain-containing protein [Armatimonadota bacterium]
MARRYRSPWWVLVFVIVIGGFLGSVIAEAVGQYPAFQFLARSVGAGLDPPLTVDLRLLRLTIGFTVRLNLAMLVGIILAIWIYRLL